jgi:hypothetical protein
MLTSAKFSAEAFENKPIELTVQYYSFSFALRERS